MVKTFNGIDVSEFQGNINWTKVKNAGIDFAIIRAGYGSTAQQADASFAANIKGAVQNKITVGAYWFSYALNESAAVNEAKACMQVLEPYKNSIAYPVFFDYEYDSVDYAKKKGVAITKEKATAFALAFMKTMVAGGYNSGYYANSDFLNRYIDKKKLSNYEFWLADWGSNSGAQNPAIPSQGMQIWQYTSKGRVDGIGGNVDMNISFKEYQKPATPTPKPEESVTKPEAEKTEAVYYTVQSGDTLSEIAAKFGSSVSAIANANNIKNVNLIYTGQKFLIPNADTAPKSVVYIVRSGDTLSQIAEKYSTTYQKLAADNNIKNPNLIYPGQRIVINSK